MRGLNCTVPHKIAVMEYLDEISESARLIGAVNTINQAALNIRLWTGLEPDRQVMLQALEQALSQ